jgi:hypothetical protein
VHVTHAPNASFENDHIGSPHVMRVGLTHEMRRVEKLIARKLRATGAGHGR